MVLTIFIFGIFIVKNFHDKAGLTPLQLVPHFVNLTHLYCNLYLFLFCCHKFNTHCKHNWKVKFCSFFIAIHGYFQYPQLASFWKLVFCSFFIAISWYFQYQQFVGLYVVVSFSQIMGIFNTYGLLPQSYKTLPSNGTFCMYWVCETQNLKISTVSITDYLQNAYVYQLSGMQNVANSIKQLLSLL